LTCADLIAKRRAPKDAVKIYQGLTDTKEPLPIRVGASMGLARCDTGKTVETVLGLLKSKERPMAIAGCQLVRELDKGNPQATRAWAAALPSLEPELQAFLVTALGERGDKVAREVVTEKVDSTDEAMRQAAIRALGALGTADSVPVLAEAVSKTETLANVVTEALTQVNAPGADAKLVECLTKSASAPEQASLMKAMRARQTPGAVPALLKASESNEWKVWQAAFDALAVVAGEADLGKLVDALVQAKDDSRRSAAVKAISSISRDLKSPEAGVKCVTEALPKADKAGQAALLELLPKFGGQAALEAARKPLAGNDAELKEAAVRALSNWPSADPMADLLKIAETDQGSLRILALRGLAKTATLPGGPAKPQRTGNARKSLKLAADPPRGNETPPAAWTENRPLPAEAAINPTSGK
jgi:HEAT repeat protein